MHTLHRDVNGNAVVNAMIENKDKLLKTIESVVKSKTYSEDIFQDGVIKAYGVKTDDIRCPIGYAFRMVYNLALDESRRRRQKMNNHRSIDQIHEITAPVPTVLDQLVAAETLRNVLASLEALPKRTNDAFIRHRLNGVPQKDIAAELGVSRTLVNFMIKAAEEHCHLAIAEPAFRPDHAHRQQPSVSPRAAPAANRSTAVPALPGQRRNEPSARSRRTG
ncbi:sigma-70 family RNA polymerase sigma factor [Rhizobium laguerreae]|uniref:sigma-70 family RNA polymerase sigma factor n=1 Tax=Rhizobium laguerreae TaxID=1076926 RepID=UPI001C903ED7|nr:sigma-70 family RNA polymerase sigma factor [Rhizobium laguerreae]MBY3343328.1 sigma-70 family RNA polymerase sigma factor [Rhizobium laguerreae]MBY3350361.1 sigma-70 family RNA polymerase sigma factor [Rhizobium laguerreae]MBY3365093.1 sigma-70 family RNA polymerase sigma factor [Rhizobium laguerreae]MBY3371466.1 sigma-70 family RNA polymerase sigma factor [Rhizobium laguerreae]MBY3384296.1 sigma-70 family RNA polymerase sigma factor [Rhizobium laguerreae]